MEVKSGYRHTEVGLIPEDWGVSELESVARIVDPQPDHRTPPEAVGGDPYIGISDFLDDYTVDWDACRKIIPAAVDKQRTSFRIRSGDIIFGKIGTIGLPRFAPRTHFRYALSANVLLIQPTAQPYFVMSWLKSTTCQIAIIAELHSTSQAAFGINKMRRVKIPVPPKTEQEAIASALSDADSLVEALERLIAKKRQIKQGTMQNLLTGKYRVQGFTENWDLKPLRDMCRQIVDGTHFTPHYVEIGVPFYSVENVTANDFINTKFISRVEHNQLTKRCKLDKGDILLTRIGSIGDTKLIDWDVDASIYVSLALLKVNQRVDPRYLYCYSKCRQFKRDLEDRSLLNASPKKINMGAIGDVMIPLPSLPEQAAIAAILADLDDELVALDAKLSKFREIKHGMMQELLTGRIRLV